MNTRYGILKFKITFDDVPTFTTLASVPTSVVVVDPTLIKAPAALLVQQQYKSSLNLSFLF